MTDVIPLDIPASQTGTAQVATPVYRYLMHQPAHWMRQAFFVGRPNYLSRALSKTCRQTSATWQKLLRIGHSPLTAVEEALDYYQRFHDLILADATDELALSEDLARRPSQTP